MLTKCFVAGAAAAALSVSLAGMALADKPADPGSAGSGIGSGGVPQNIGTFLDTGVTPSLIPGGAPIAPGKVIGELANEPGNVPTNVGQFEANLWATHSRSDGAQVQSVWGPTPPGMSVKFFTPGCGIGRTAVTDGTSATCAKNGGHP
jgi:hypothetical protein